MRNDFATENNGSNEREGHQVQVAKKTKPFIASCNRK